MKGHNWGVCRLCGQNHGKHPKGMLNKKHLPETKTKIGETLSKNRRYDGKLNPFYGRHHSDKTKQILSEIFSDRNGKKNPMYGRHHSKKTKELISENHSGRDCYWLKGKKLSKEQKEKMSLKKIGKLNNNWCGGISFEPYGLGFNNKLKEQIRERDNFTCQECKQHQKKLGYVLSVHHIDYNKKNHHPDNLISLCKHCHTKTNSNREYWTSHFNLAVYHHPLGLCSIEPIL